MKKIELPEDLFFESTSLKKWFSDVTNAVNELQEENHWLWKFHHAHDAIGKAVVPHKQTQEPECDCKELVYNGDPESRRCMKCMKKFQVRPL